MAAKELAGPRQDWCLQPLSALVQRVPVAAMKRGLLEGLQRGGEADAAGNGAGSLSESSRA